MAVTYLGSLTLADVLPGPAKGLADLKAALDGLRSTVTAQLDVLAAAKASIRIAAIAELEAQLDAALDVGASLSANLSDPSTFIGGILSGLVTVQGNIGAIVPTLALSASIEANATITAELKAKIAAFDVALEVLGAISLALQAALAASVVIAIDLSATGGVAAFRVDAQIGAMGTELDDELAGGLPGGGGPSLATHGLFFVAESPAAWAGMRAAFRTE